MENKFRGYCHYLKKWVVGPLSTRDSVHGIQVDGELKLVDSRSIGMSLGDTDRNNVEVFEGDTIRTTCGRTLNIKREGSGKFIAIDVDNGERFTCSSCDGDIEFEVIANEFENGA
jgi:hypothetical protein